MVDELSVAENIFLYGIIYGMERSSIREKLEEIIEWAELEDLFGGGTKNTILRYESPVGLFSDPAFRYGYIPFGEAFAVGDKDFRAKYEEVFRNHRNGDRTYLIATHDLDFARLFCRQTIWLQKGRLMAFGETEGVLDPFLSTGSRSRQLKCPGTSSMSGLTSKEPSPTIRHR